MEQPTPRRQFLHALGISVALPWFESWPPKLARAASKIQQATTAGGAPLRTAYLYVPNGVIVPRWTPDGAGTDYQLNDTMEPLADFKADFQVLSGFEHKNGWAGKDGAGDHARAGATILTGARPKKTGGSDIRLGVSIDQLTAHKIGHLTRFPSLELSCDGVRKSGSCDSGYSCAYQFNLSWRSATTPMAPEANPRLVFERLFGHGDPSEREQNRQLRRQQKLSLLDFVLEDARRLKKQLGHRDQQKLDEYLFGIRQLEQQIDRSERFAEIPDPRDYLANGDRPDGIPRAYREHLRLMFDMLVLAFQTDLTRIATFLLAHDGSNRNFPDIGVSEGHHTLSHHQNDADKIEKLARIDRFYMEQFAYFLSRMKHLKDVHDRPLLENSMIVYASGLSDGNRHRHDNLPVILAGQGGGVLTPGRHLQVPKSTPMTNLYLTMLDKLGIAADSFGDSTGRLESL